MKYWTDFNFIEKKTIGKKKNSLYDNNIFTFDIETSSLFMLNNKIYSTSEYLKLDKKEQEEAEFFAIMYIWQFSINETVYYGRTWEEFKKFIKILDSIIPEKKFVFVHNLSFEFQFLKSFFNIKNMFARKARKPISFELADYNFEFRCSYFMSNCALKQLPKIFNLTEKKLVGDLDYSLIRTPLTKITAKELKYCENDCLIVYEYIQKEMEEYGTVKKIPRTSTGHVRRELFERIQNDYNYKKKVKKAINTDTHVYNLLVEAFMGGFTHANYMYTDKIIKNVDSWDFTSSYPYVLVTHKYPSTEFKKCNLKNEKDMISNFAYLLVVKFKNLKSRYYNNFLSQSRCRNIIKAKYDNGRIIEAEELEITLTDVDFKLLLLAYDAEYEITESYYSVYNYLPKTFIEFVLEKYVNKTKLKGIESKKVEYAKEKNKFNALYGMSVTNMIKDNVFFENDKDWYEEKITNKEIIELLEKEKKKSFLSFAYGVWVTAYARNNLIKNVMKLDSFVIYCDTDSMKLAENYDKNVILDYNNFVEQKINRVAKVLDIDINKFMPVDQKGNKRMLGVFDFDGHYDEFITQRCKKICNKN